VHHHTRCVYSILSSLWDSFIAGIIVCVYASSLSHTAGELYSASAGTVFSDLIFILGK